MENNDELKFENELEKLRQQAELGASFFETGNELPPEIEAEWLKNIRAFEETDHNAPARTVNEILGYPALKPVSEINEANVGAELEAVLQLLAEKSIEIDYDESVPATERYRFIIEDILKHEMGFFYMPGMTMHLMYEEFYPNHAKDIIRRCDSFCNNLFRKTTEYMEIDFDRGIVLPGDIIISREEFVAGVAAWFETVDRFEVHDIKYKEPEFNLEQKMGHVHTWFDYDVVAHGISTHFSGPGIFYLSYESEYWHIFGMDFPGFSMISEAMRQ